MPANPVRSRPANPARICRRKVGNMVLILRPDPTTNLLLFLRNPTDRVALEK